MYGYQSAEILDVEGLEIYCVTLGLFHKIVPLITDRALQVQFLLFHS